MRARLLTIGALCAGITAAAPVAWAQTGELVARTEFRVCADPAHLPYSNKAGEGFENRIAEMFAEALGLPLTYTWYPNTVGFVRNTLRARLCDVIMGIGGANEMVQNTNPYYRTGYVMAYRTADGPALDAFDAEALRDRKLGVVAGTPPATLLALNGLIGKAKPYHLMVDTRIGSPPRDMMEDLAAGIIDVAFIWGPLGGYWAGRMPAEITLVPLESGSGRLRMDFRISLGIRYNEPDWKHQLNDLIAEKQDEINAILLEYGVPLIDDQGAPITRGSITVPEPRGYRMGDYRAPVPATLEGATVVATADVQALGDDPQAVLIDVMPAPRRPKEHTGRIWRGRPRDSLPGSVWLPNVGYGELSPEFEAWFTESLAQLTGGDPERPLVFYCERACWMSWNAARRAVALGYSDVRWYPEGTDGWREAGLPLVAAEPEPMPDFVEHASEKAAAGS